MMITGVLHAQQHAAVELEVFSRYDKHASYITRYFGRFYTDAIRLWGFGNGLRVQYNHPISNRMCISAGVGYTRLSIDKIRSDSQFGNNIPSSRVGWVHTQCNKKNKANFKTGFIPGPFYCKNNLPNSRSQY